MVLLVSLCKCVNILSDFRWRREKICTHFQRTEAQETRGSLREEVRPQGGTCTLQRPKAASALLSEAHQCHFVPTRLKRNAATLIFTLLKLTLSLDIFFIEELHFETCGICYTEGGLPSLLHLFFFLPYDLSVRIQLYRSPAD